MIDELPKGPPNCSETCDGEKGEARSGQAELLAFFYVLNRGTLETLGQIVRGKISPEEIQMRAEALRHGYAQFGLAAPLQDEDGKDSPSSSPVSNE